MKTIEPGASLEVLATDPGSVKDLAAWARTTGNTLVEQSEDGGTLPLRPATEMRDRP